MQNFPITKFAGQRLRLLRIKSGLTEHEICNQLQMPAGTFSILENGTADIPLWRLSEIAQFFCVDLQYFIIGKENASITDLNLEVEVITRINLQQAEEITRLRRKVIELYSDLGSHDRIR